MNVSMRGLSVSYGAQAVLADFDLTLATGGLYALLGASGSGKSTLLKVLCGIKRDYCGAIEYDGATQQPPVGYVPQNYGLLDWKTARDNIYLLPQLASSVSQIDEAAIDNIINTLQIQDILHKYPRELSGGQKQRVALARAFALKPGLLLMDEPFSALDTFTSAACQALFRDIWLKHRVTALFITHNINEAVASAKTILLMDNHSHKVTKTIDNHAFGGSDIDRMTLVGEIMGAIA